ncbi:MAG: phosphatase PAP2 family protein [Lachnospiraceae bacterium]|nr:phosphatase PAP2 family protein [Lachnospiraceae bacterium]
MELTGTGFSIPAEVAFMEWLQAHIGESAMRLVSAFSMFGEELLLILILGFIYWCRDKKMGQFVALNLLLSIVWGPMIKNVFVRRRPYFDYEQIQILRPVEPKADVYDIAAQGYSFPSVHSANAVAAYGSVAFWEGKQSSGRRKAFRYLTTAAVVLSLLVGFSRVAVGAHYPTDVLGGWLLGLVIVFAVPALCRKVTDRRILCIILLALTVPGLIWCRSDDYFSGLGLFLGFLAGFAFEDRFVRFENTRKALPSVIRLALGLALFAALYAVLKLPFLRDFLGSGIYAARMFACGWYALISFIEFGVYPYFFKWIK